MNTPLPLAAVLVALGVVRLHAGSISSSSQPPPLPMPVASFGAAALDDAIFLYGGHSGVRHRYNREEVHGDLFRWRPGADAWERLAAGEPSQGASLIGFRGSVLRIGGMAARNARGEKQELWSSRTADRFLLSQRRWESLPDLPARRSSHDSVVIDETLYVIGGWRLEGGTRTGGGSEPVWHATYLTLNLAESGGRWQSHPQPFKRRALAVQALGHELYAIGGMTDGDETTTEVSILDTRTGHWRSGPALPEDKLGGFGFSAVAHKGRLFASGATGELLELRGDSWKSIARLQHPRFFHRLVAGAPGHLVALGGESREGNKAPPEVVSLPPWDSEPLKDDAEARTATLPASPAPVMPTGLAPAESDWPGYQGPRGNSTTPEVGWLANWPADGPPVLWKAELGKGLASFAVTGDRACTAGNDGADQDTLWYLDLSTGQPVWKHQLPVKTRAHEMPIVPYGPAATPTIAEGRVFFLSREGDLLCLDAASGKVSWQKNVIRDFGGKRPVYGYAGSPWVDQGRLYLDVGSSSPQSGPGSTVCLDARTGQVIWQAGEGEAGYATPFVTTHDGNRTLIAFKGEALEIRSVDDGALLARHPTQTRDFCNCATPVRHQNLLFISHTGNMGSRVLAWDELALTEVWTDRRVGLLFNSGLPWQGHLLVFNDEKRGANDLRLIDLATGQARWQTSDVDKGTGLLSDDGLALILTNKGELVLARVLAERLDILNRVQVLPGKSWVQPVLSHRRLLCKNNEGSTVCLDLRETRAGR